MRNIKESLVFLYFIIVLFGCSTTSPRTPPPSTDPGIYAFIAIIKHSTAIFHLAMAPSLYYCQNHQWPSTEAILATPNPGGEDIRAITNNLSTTIDDKNGYHMQFQMVMPAQIKMDSNHIPQINVFVPAPPSPKACRQAQLSITNIQMNIRVPDQKQTVMKRNLFGQLKQMVKE